MWYDLFIGAVLVFSIFRGAQRGAIFQVAAIASVVLCFIFAEAISAAVGPHVPLKAPLNNWVVMVAAYLVFSFASFGFARVLQRWIEGAGMQEFNKHVGGAFGLAKGVVLALVITFFAVTLSPKSRALLRDSRSGQLAADVMEKIHPVMPQNLQRALDNYRMKFEGNPIPAEPYPGNTRIATPPAGQTPGQLSGSGQNPWELTPNLGPGETVPGSQPAFDPFADIPHVATNQPPQQPGSQPTSSWGEWTPQPTSQPQQPTSPQVPSRQPQPTGGFSVEEVMNRLPYALSGEMNRVVRDVLQNSSTQQRAAFEQDLRQADYSDWRTIATDYLTGRATQYLNGQSQPSQGGATNAPRANPSYPNGYPSQANPANGYGQPVPQPTQQWSPWSPQPTTPPQNLPAQQPTQQNGFSWDNALNSAAQQISNNQSGGMPATNGSQSVRDQLGNAAINFGLNQLSQQFGGQQPAHPQPTNQQPTNTRPSYPSSGYPQAQPQSNRVPVQPVAGSPRPAQTVPGLAALQQQLRGVPRNVAEAVIVDYTADQMNTADPDPRTNASTPLQQRYNAAADRIARQSSGYGASY